VKPFLYWLALGFDVAPAAIVIFAWTRKNERGLGLTVTSASALLLLAGFFESWRLHLWGPTYSSRLYWTIYLNAFLAFASGIFSAMKKRIAASVASIWLAGVWMFLGALNSVV
jgi:hypothetical protein